LRQRCNTTFQFGSKVEQTYAEAGLDYDSLNSSPQQPYRLANFSEIEYDELSQHKFFLDLQGI